MVKVAKRNDFDDFQKKVGAAANLAYFDNDRWPTIWTRRYVGWGGSLLCRYLIIFAFNLELHAHQSTSQSPRQT
jgi:hypothetical protein